MANNIFAGVIANFLFTVITVIALYILYFILRRRSLHAFFGVNPHGEVIVYLSRLEVKPFGALGAIGEPLAFSGTAVSSHEAAAATKIETLFKVSVPGKAVQPSWLAWVLVADVSIRVVPAPTPGEGISFHSTVITVGGPAFNIVSRAVQHDLKAPVGFNDKSTNIMLPNLPPVESCSQSFIARIRHNRGFVFYCAGLNQVTTAAALLYLATSWQSLHRKYQRTPSFYVLLESAAHDYSDTRVVAEGPLAMP